MKSMRSIYSKNILILPKTQYDAIVIPVIDGKLSAFGKKTDKIFGFSARLSEYINTYGNRAFNLGYVCYGGLYFRLYTFPISNPKNPSESIKSSAKDLVERVEKYGSKTVYFPPFLCKDKAYDWKYDIKPLLKDIFDDRFCVVIGSKS